MKSDILPKNETNKNLTKVHRFNIQTLEKCKKKTKNKTKNEKQKNCLEKEKRKTVRAQCNKFDHLKPVRKNIGQILSRGVYVTENIPPDIKNIFPKILDQSSRSSRSRNRVFTNKKSIVSNKHTKSVNKSNQGFSFKPQVVNKASSPIVESSISIVPDTDTVSFQYSQSVTHTENPIVINKSNQGHRRHKNMSKKSKPRVEKKKRQTKQPNATTRCNECLGTMSKCISCGSEIPKCSSCLSIIKSYLKCLDDFKKCGRCLTVFSRCGCCHGIVATCGDCVSPRCDTKKRSKGKRKAKGKTQVQNDRMVNIDMEGGAKNIRQGYHCADDEVCCCLKPCHSPPCHSPPCHSPPCHPHPCHPHPCHPHPPHCHPHQCHPHQCHPHHCHPHGCHQCCDPQAQSGNEISDIQNEGQGSPPNYSDRSQPQGQGSPGYYQNRPQGQGSPSRSRPQGQGSPGYGSKHGNRQQGQGGQAYHSNYDDRSGHQGRGNKGYRNNYEDNSISNPQHSYRGNSPKNFPVNMQSAFNPHFCNKPVMSPYRFEVSIPPVPKGLDDPGATLQLRCNRPLIVNQGDCESCDMTLNNCGHNSNQNPNSFREYHKQVTLNLPSKHNYQYPYQHFSTKVKKHQNTSNNINYHLENKAKHKVKHSIDRNCPLFTIYGPVNDYSED